MLVLKFKKVLRISSFRGVPWGEATSFPFFLDLEGDGFNLFGGDNGVATGEEYWLDCLDGDPTTLEVATDGEAIIFEGEEKGDLGKGKAGWLDNISIKVV